MNRHIWFHLHIVRYYYKTDSYYVIVPTEITKHLLRQRKWYCIYMKTLLTKRKHYVCVLFSIAV